MNYLKTLMIFFVAYGCGSPEDYETETLSDQVSLAINSQIYMHKNKRLVSFRVSQGELESWNRDNYDLAKSYTQSIYSYFDDKFDVILFIVNSPKKPEATDYYGKLVSIKNETLGLGLDLFDKSYEYGSQGKLKAILHLPAISLIRKGPSLHEFSHMFANYILDGKAINYKTGKEQDMRSHWGFIGSGKGKYGGQLGGFSPAYLKELGGNVWKVEGGFGVNANGGNSLPYSPLELYLMGFSDKNIVDGDIIYFTSLRPYDKTLNEEQKKDLYFYGTKNSISIEQLVKDKGERVPSFSQSQKQFRILSVLLTSEKVSDVEWEETDEALRLLCLEGDDKDDSIFNFWEATKGVGSLKATGLDSALINIE
jgi:hypothetical protein